MNGQSSTPTEAAGHAAAHHRTKQRGGYCCKYSKSNNYCGGLGRPEDVDRESKQSSAGRVVVDGRYLEIFFTRHAFIHMEDIGLRCYDESGFREWLLAEVPRMHIARPTMRGNFYMNLRGDRGVGGTFNSSVINAFFIKYYLQYSASAFITYTGVVTINGNYYKITFNKHKDSTSVRPKIRVFAVYRAADPHRLQVDIPRNLYIHERNDLVHTINPDCSHTRAGSQARADCLASPTRGGKTRHRKKSSKKKKRKTKRRLRNRKRKGGREKPDCAKINCNVGANSGPNSQQHCEKMGCGPCKAVAGVLGVEGRCTNIRRRLPGFLGDDDAERRWRAANIPRPPVNPVPNLEKRGGSRRKRRRQTKRKSRGKTRRRKGGRKRKTRRRSK